MPAVPSAGFTRASTHSLHPPKVVTDGDQATDRLISHNSHLLPLPRLRSAIIASMFDSWEPQYSLGGQMVDPGRLHPLGDRYAEAVPVACRNGHPLGAGQLLVGSIACLAAIGGLHRTHRCRTCEYVIFTPNGAGTCEHQNGPATCTPSTGAAG